MRDGFADILKGLGIREEVQDMGDLVDRGDGTYAPARPTRADVDRQNVRAADEAAQAMDAEYASTVSGQMPDTAEEKGEVAEGPEEATDAQMEAVAQETAAREKATPEPGDDYVEGMLKRFGGIGTLDALQTAWAEGGPEIHQLSDYDYERLDTAYGERSLELSKGQPE